MNRQAPSKADGHLILSAVITILALADGALHFLLDFVLFHGTFIGTPQLGPPPGPPPGAPSSPPPAPPPMPPWMLPVLSHLNELFLLNAIGYVALVLVFWFGRGWLGARRWLLDVVIIIYTAISILGWVEVGEPNPNGLGYISKVIEVVLIVVLAAHIWTVIGERGVAD